MQKGDCFWGDPAGGSNPHPWLVLSSPNSAGEIAIVNLTTGLGGVKAHQVKPSSLPILKYDSEVAWFEAITYDNAQADKRVSAKLWTWDSNIPSNRVDAIINQGLMLGLISRELKAFLKKAGSSACA